MSKQGADFGSIYGRPREDASETAARMKRTSGGKPNTLVNVLNMIRRVPPKLRQPVKSRELRETSAYTPTPRSQRVIVRDAPHANPGHRRGFRGPKEGIRIDQPPPRLWRVLPPHVDPVEVKQPDPQYM